VRFADQNEQDGRIGRPTLAALVLVVVAFMVLSLVVTATGTARFATSMGYDVTVGYAVGAVFDIAKGILPVGVMALLARRALGTAALLGVAWICLVFFSCLATHATSTTAISAIERLGTWQMEVRGNTKAELATVEQQLAALSRPGPPRPAKTVREALAAERVPVSVWQDSQECGRIQESAHFARACAQVVQLRRELAAALDYERLSARANELRKGLAEAPIVATSDPLPAAFSATLGRLVSVSGTEGVALLLTVVVELISCCGLAALSVLYKGRDQAGPGTGKQSSLPGPQGSLPVDRYATSATASGTLPKPSLKAVASGRTSPGDQESREASDPPSNVLPMRPRAPSRALPEGASPGRLCQPGALLAETQSHVPAFVQQRLHSAKGMSVAAKDLRAAYEAWCATQGYEPLSMPRLAAELKTLGYDKWKSCGLMRYRDLKLVA
jgi:hypothetical protein